MGAIPTQRFPLSSLTVVFENVGGRIHTAEPLERLAAAPSSRLPGAKSSAFNPYSGSWPPVFASPETGTRWDRQLRHSTISTSPHKSAQHNDLCARRHPLPRSGYTTLGVGDTGTERTEIVVVVKAQTNVRHQKKGRQMEDADRRGAGTGMTAPGVLGCAATWRWSAQRDRGGSYQFRNAIEWLSVSPCSLIMRMTVT